MQVRVEGLLKLKQGLEKYRQVKLAKLTVGITRACRFLKAESQKIVPVDYGNLKASAGTRIEDPNTPKVKGFVYYTAKYAIYVHEDLDKLHGAAFNAAYAKELLAAAKAKKKGKKVTGPFRHRRGDNQQAKFLETPLREKRQQIKAIIIYAME